MVGEDCDEWGVWWVRWLRRSVGARGNRSAGQQRMTQTAASTRSKTYVNLIVVSC